MNGNGSGGWEMEVGVDACLIHLMFFHLFGVYQREKDKRKDPDTKDNL